MKPTVSCFALLLVCLSLAAIANEAPVLTELAPFEFAEGRAFSVLQMNQIVSDPDHSFGELEWSVLETDFAYVSAMGTQIYFGVIDAAWTGTATITLVVCDPDGACDQQALSVTVQALNDPPALQIPDQLIQAGQSFPVLSLETLVIDDDDELASLQWTVSWQDELQIEIVNGSASIAVPSADWIGVEYVEFGVCDPQAACDTQIVAVGRLDGSELRAQYIANGGYVLEVAGLKIAMDALFTMGATSAMTRDMRNATAPFDVDVILVTANDSYHASPSILAAHFAANADAVLIAPADLIAAVQALDPSIDSSRMFAIDPAVGVVEVVEAAGLAIDVAGYIHADEGDDPALAFRFDVNGRSVLFLGEVDEQSLLSEANNAFATASFDYAFIPSYAFTLENQTRNPLRAQSAWSIPTCQRSSVFGCSCAYTGDEEHRVLCFEEEMEQRLLPTN